MNLVAVLCSMLIFGIAVDAALQKVKEHVINMSRNIPLKDLFEPDWWETASLYQIYPRSFKDSNNDGNGDLQGIIQKLDYIKDTGIDAIWLSPIFKSPQIDTGYDVSDYRDIDPTYGTLDDLRQLLDEAHKLNIKVLLDYVPNHTSDQHEWFQASLKRDSKYDNYYVWENATYIDGERNPPNNWISFSKDSAWEWNEDRQQYYLHQFSIAQPDLNYRNPVVVEEMKDVLRYWLNFGVDGFRMDAVGTLFEDALLRDEPRSYNPTALPNEHDYLDHIYTTEQEESFDMLYEWRDVLDEFTNTNNVSTRVMITEGGANPDTIQFYYANLNISRLGAHFTFNFISFITDLHKGFSGDDLFFSLDAWSESKLYFFTDNWVLGNHNNPRVATRLGIENIDILNMLVSILRGAQVTYQGEEIGQEDGEVTCEEGTDPQAIKNCSTFVFTSRDFERTPFQWDNSTNAGFNGGAKTWLPVSDKYVETNLASQNVADINSHYNIYKEVLKLRQIFKKSTDSDVVIIRVESSNIFRAQRITNNANYVFYYNGGDAEATILLPPVACADCITVAVRNPYSEYIPGDTFNVSQPLKPREAVLSIVTES